MISLEHAVLLVCVYLLCNNQGQHVANGNLHSGRCSWRTNTERGLLGLVQGRGKQNPGMASKKRAVNGLGVGSHGEDRQVWRKMRDEV